MSNLSILGLYDNPDSAADALDALHDSGFDSNDFDVLTGTPFQKVLLGNMFRSIGYLGFHYLEQLWG